MKTIDASRMSRDERMAELGEILATGAQRVLTRGFKRFAAKEISRDRLDVVGDVEAPCRFATEASA